MFFFSSRRRHTRWPRDWSSDVALPIYSDNLFELTSHTGEVHYSRTIIITAGNGAFEPRRLNINTSEDFENVNLHCYVDDMNRYADEHVMLLGGGDSAVDWALMLEPIADKVTLVHRRKIGRAHV